MNEKYLTLEQNICSARIFLNIFGLVLEDANDINEFSKLKIFDKNGNIVGELYFDIGKLYIDNSKVILSANYNNAYLEASYDIARALNVDYHPSSGLYSSYEIDFNLSRQNEPKISGVLSMWRSADAKYGFYCFCRPLIKCAIPNIGDVTLMMAQNRAFSYEYHFINKVTSETAKDGVLLGVDITKGDVRTNFQIASSPRYFYYDLTAGDYDEDLDAGYPYHKVGYIDDGIREEKEDKLIVRSYKSGCPHLMPFDTGITTFIDEFVNKDKNGKKLLLTKSKYMLKIYPYVYRRIREIRNALMIGDVSLLDNLISVCYDSYTDEEIECLIGLRRERGIYQDGANTLVDSYFGTGKSNTFFPIEKQQKLVRENK